MSRVVERRFVLLSGFLALTIWISPSLVEANHAWGNYHWARTRNPVTLLVGDNVTSEWDSQLLLAASDWDNGAVAFHRNDVINPIVTNGASISSTCRPTLGRIEVCNAPYGENGWLGLARIWANSDSHITQATTQLNDTYFVRPEYNSPSMRQFVVCQEVGHTFGLDHQDEAFDNPN